MYTLSLRVLCQAVSSLCRQTIATSTRAGMTSSASSACWRLGRWRRQNRRHGNRRRTPSQSLTRSPTSHRCPPLPSSCPPRNSHRPCPPTPPAVPTTPPRRHIRFFLTIVRHQLVYLCSTCSIWPSSVARSDCQSTLPRGGWIAE